MSRRGWLWLSGAVTIVVGLVLVATDGPMWDAGGPGIVGFELAGSEEKAAEILVEWGDEGRDAARLSLWLDFLYLAAYGTFVALLAAATRDRAHRVGWEGFARAGRLAIVAAPLAAAFDAIEDVNLLLVLGGHGGSVAPVLAAGCATLKFALIAFAIGYVLVGLARQFPRGAVGLAALLAAFVAVTVVVEQRRTVGGVGLYAVEDGSPVAPPLVLIHGYGLSQDWWDPVAPQLARSFRVIRMDLRGMGRSPKPARGYGIDDQADAVAGALQRFDVAGATVVGHSLGGAVATALAERHPRLVARLMVIGTGPAIGQGSLPIGLKLAVLPVTGQLIRAYTPDAWLRGALEDTLRPEVDLPPALAGTLDRMTARSFRRAQVGLREYSDEAPIDARVRRLRLPFAAVFGTDDEQGDDADRYRRIPGARVVELPGLGHSPQVERPRLVARLIADFAALG